MRWLWLGHFCNEDMCLRVEKISLERIVAQSVHIVEPVLDLLLFSESVTETGKLSLGIVILQAHGGHGWFQQRLVG